MSVRPSLWPEDIAVTDAIAPATILKEQASLLGQRTQNLVEARVSAERSFLVDFPFCYNFALVAPALDNYRYDLFKIQHGLDFYPVKIDFEDSGYPRIVGDEEQLMQQLKVIFSSHRTKGIISSLIAQSKV
jgi:hypothetical protein